MSPEPTDEPVPRTVSPADEEDVNSILVEWTAQAMLRPSFELAAVADLKIASCVDTADRAVALVREHHSRWLKEPTP